jgi:hypothetical protein
VTGVAAALPEADLTNHAIHQSNGHVPGLRSLAAFAEPPDQCWEERSRLRWR